ncbi:hypothetical protein KQX54_010099 [Cotesia glomerata]|uniref:Uncharacterized protein n=1 Tax=Cotesia glomerata TaxID=32391 RepID=A0AAV7IEJ2_COTGL|nr:hypothetical protein KQX54_010099 [Cotesia glomerata]
MLILGLRCYSGVKLYKETICEYELTLTLITGNSTGPALNDHIWADRFTIPWLLRAHDSLIEDPAPSKEDPEPSIEYPAQHPRAKSLVAGVLAGSQLTLPYTPYTPLAAIPGDS